MTYNVFGGMLIFNTSDSIAMPVVREISGTLSLSSSKTMFLITERARQPSGPKDTFVNFTGPTQPSIPPGSVMSNNIGWEGKGRYGSFRYAGCAGKTVRSLENVCHT